MVAVIGDLHGCYYTLLELVQTVRNKYGNISIYSVGDLIDRGNYGYEVIEYLKREQIHFTPGNHDYMFYYFINFPESVMGSSWLYNGYEKTLTGYDERPEMIWEHLNFITGSPLFFNLDDCFISHAGISKYYKFVLQENYLNDDKALGKILMRDLEEEHSIIWTRGELMNIGKLQVVGHTRRKEVTFNKASNAVYIDTSAYAGNKLSAVIIKENTVVDVMSVATKKEDVI